ncbi:hypothetical protein V6N12_063067 [Hibiscus sabdariffa]|uniref:CRIB domain-containing protein n=1 Tax=Hibiscus sabdariffa TaxID=183260 RepID=A0ABR2FAQ6_9ROSI
MEIGNPTDVRHVAHIGMDHSSTIEPSWMNEFKIGSDNTAKPTDIDQSMGSQPTIEEVTRNRSCSDLPSVTKKRRRRKRSTSVVVSSSTKSPR